MKVLILLLCLALPALAQPLASWNEAPRQRIVDFVSEVTREGGAHFLPPERRIAVFDNDGTLWSEQPVYFQFFYALDRLKRVAPKHPEWKRHQPFKAALEGDLKTLATVGEKGFEELIMATHAGMTTDEYTADVQQWARTARHPRFHKLYTEMVFQPMLELLAYLRENGFRTYIVSGGGIDFMRPWTQSVYGIPPEQVIGSSLKTRYELRNGVPVLVHRPQIEFIDDGPGKPEGIHMFLGLTPVLAFGNSDGDQQMLEWTARGKGLHLTGLVHHTDAAREWAYDRKSLVGKLDKALDEALRRNWLVVDMKNDWKVIYPFQKAP